MALFQIASITHHETFFASPALKMLVLLFQDHYPLMQTFKFAFWQAHSAFAPRPLFSSFLGAFASGL